MRQAPRSESKRPLVLGHRGARQSAPENTLLAFERALEEGADGVELDVRLTAEGAIVVFHDAELDRREPSKLKISELSLGEVRAARSGAAQIPTLDEVLAWQDKSGAFLNIELKGDGQSPLELAARVADRIKGRTSTLLSSFHPLIVSHLARAVPEMKTALLVEREQLASWAFSNLSSLGTSAIHPEQSLLDEPLIKRLRSEGVAWLGTWTVNDPKRAAFLSELGVDTIITDTPRQVLKQLA